MRGLSGTRDAHCAANRSRCCSVGLSGASRPSANASMNARSRSRAASSVRKRSIAWRDRATRNAVRLSIRNSSAAARRAGRPSSTSSRLNSASRGIAGRGLRRENGWRIASSAAASGTNNMAAQPSQAAIRQSSTVGIECVPLPSSCHIPDKFAPTLHGSPLEPNAAFSRERSRRLSGSYLSLDFGSRLALDRPEVMCRLQIEPELGRGPEVPGQAQSGICRHSSPAVDDVVHACRRNVNRLGQRVGRHCQWHKKFFPQDFAGVDRTHSILDHAHIAESGRSMAFRP